MLYSVFSDAEVMEVHIREFKNRERIEIAYKTEMIFKNGFVKLESRRAWSGSDVTSMTSQKDLVGVHEKQA